MLSFERIAYGYSINDCKCGELDALIAGHKTEIYHYASDIGVDAQEVIRQIILHAPQFPKGSCLENSFLSRSIYPILNSLFETYTDSFNHYRELCGSELLHGRQAKVKKAASGGQISAIYNNGDIQPLHADVVNAQTGEFLETQLHYLRAFRDDARCRYGLFFTGRAAPICYASFSIIDRDDKINSLQKALCRNINKSEVIELARVYGCGNLPANAISSLIGLAARMLREEGYQYMITAVNLSVGFTGESVFGSGFVPYAFRPVNYQYDQNRFYTTKRKGNAAFHSLLEMPDNVLLVKYIGEANKRLRQPCKLVKITPAGTGIISADIEYAAHSIRQKLERIWSEKTRSRGTDMSGSSRLSKGQGEASSLLLAKRLSRKDHQIVFCEGGVSFDREPGMNIDPHYWVKILNYKQHGKDIIIDITADQNGYAKKTILMSTAELEEKKGIFYRSASEKKPDDIDAGHLVQRLNYLEHALRKNNSSSGVENA